MLRIELLGGLRLEADGQPIAAPESRRARTLLAWLALHPGQHGRSRLAGVLRPDVEEEDARRSLRQATWLVGRSLGEAGDGALVATRGEVGLDPGGVAVDIAEIRARAADGDLEAARSLRARRLLPEHDEEWAIAARDELNAELVELLGRHASRAESAGDLEGAVRWARERAAADPLSEVTQRELMRLLAASGDRAAAVQVADSLRRRLSEELGVTPSAETRAAIEQVLTTDAPVRGSTGSGSTGSGSTGSGSTAPASTAPASTAPPARAPRTGLPAPLVTVAGEPLVGREPALRAVAAGWDAVEARTPRLVALSGEPGIGKTRLVAEVATRVAAAGGAVLYGRCDEEPLASYQPFTEALERGVEDGTLAAAALPDVHTGELARMLPRFAAAHAKAPTDPDADPELARYRMFEAVRAALEAVTAERPTLLALDDMQWADGGGLALLTHLAGRLRDERLLVLMTFRDSELHVGGSHSLPRLLAQLRRQRPVDHVVIEPLEPAAIARLLPGDAAASLVDSIHRRTGGNALFVVETLRELASENGDGDGGGPVPAAVAEIVDQRVARLGESVLSVLRAAATAGLEFELRDLRTVCDLDEDELIGALDSAIEARLIREEAGLAGRFQFAHALVADAIYDGMSGTRRARMHCRLGDALAAHGAPASAVAHHLLAGTPVADPERTTQWAERAAADALRALAYDDAAALIRRALPHVPDIARRAHMLVALGDALDRAGQRDQAREAFGQAADAARESGDGEALTHAALGYKGYAVTVTTPDPRTIALLEEALATVGNEPVPRARLLAALALEGYYADQDRAREQSAEAVALARSGGGPETLAHTLSAHHLALWDGDHTADRLGIATEMARVARAAGDRVALLQARNWRVIDLLEIGKVDDTVAEIDAYEQEARELRLERFAWYVPLWRAGLAVMRGEWERAEKLSREAHERGLAAGDANADPHRRIQLNWSLFLQRRFDEIDLGWIERTAAESPAGRGAWIPWHATVSRELGDHETARALFADIAADDYAIVPRDANWHVICDAAQLTAEYGTDEQARSLLERMRPYERLNPVVGRGIGCYGPVAHYTGLLAERLGDHEEAERLYRWALEAAERIGAYPRAEASRERLEAL